MASYGGTELNAVRTVEALDRSQVTPIVLTLNAQGGMAERYTRMHVPVVQFSITSLVAPANIAALARVRRFLRDQRIDVLHAHDLYSNFFFTCAARLAGVPVVVASKRWVRQAHAKHTVTDAIGFRMADWVLTNSEAVAESAQRTERVPRERIWVVPNFVEQALFERSSESERRARLAAWGVPAGRRVIGIVARLRPEKDHVTLLRAFEIIAGALPDVDLVIVGDGPEDAPLREIARAMRLESRVHFAGAQPNRPAPQELFDVAVLCSLHEGFPNAVVEAMACATPVVATAVGGVVDVIEDGVHGLLVAPQNPVSLAEALRRMLVTPELARQLAQGGQARAAALFGETAVMHRLVGYYRWALSNSRRTLPAN
ncbi:MAG: glycosyltransferase [Gemmatimonadota bacterium]